MCGRTRTCSPPASTQQVASASAALRAGVRAAGVSMRRDALAPRAIYANPTPKRLARHLLAAARGDGAGGAEREADRTRELVAKYTEGLPARGGNGQPLRDARPDALDEGQTVLLTGSTGLLGAHLLDGLCASPRVKRVVAMNRDGDGGASRQDAASAARGLSTDWAKVDFVGVDLARPDLGLGAARYDELRGAADRIIHNAWPVNFHMGVASFEPHIRGAAKRVPIVFVSTVAAAAAWAGPGPVPERRVDDVAAADMGYSRAKLAASMILDAAAARSGLPTASVRVGQVAGARRREGVWNKREYIPSLVASSLHLGLLPESLGPGDVVD